MNCEIWGQVLCVRSGLDTSSLPHILCAVWFGYLFSASHSVYGLVWIPLLCLTFCVVSGFVCSSRTRNTFSTSIRRHGHPLLSIPRVVSLRRVYIFNHSEWLWVYTGGDHSESLWVSMVVITVNHWVSMVAITVNHWECLHLRLQWIIECLYLWSQWIPECLYILYLRSQWISECPYFWSQWITAEYESCTCDHTESPSVYSCGHSESRCVCIVVITAEYVSIFAITLNHHGVSTVVITANHGVSI